MNRVLVAFDGVLHRAQFRLLRALESRVVEVDVAGVRLRFYARSSVEYWRARSLPHKEAGTVRLIAEHVKPGDVFVDVGANVGIYTLLAAARVGPTGRVVSFEPHVGNADSLIANIGLNGFADRVDVWTVALADRRGFAPFNYNSLVRGTSQSQYGTTLDDSGAAFQPVASEMKWALPFDELRISPTHVKIDVDGLEGAVLDGMAATLTGDARPRIVQVEIGPRNADAVRERMKRYGYWLDHRHDTQAGLEKLAAGIPAEEIAHNAVYVPIEANVRS